MVDMLGHEWTNTVTLNTELTPVIQAAQVERVYTRHVSFMPIR